MKSFIAFIIKNIWAISFALGIPIAFGAGFFWSYYLAEGARKEWVEQIQKIRLEAEAQRGEIGSVGSKYEELKKAYDLLDADRKNVLTQTKKLLQERNIQTAAVERVSVLEKDLEQAKSETAQLKKQLEDLTGVQGETDEAAGERAGQLAMLKNRASLEQARYKKQLAAETSKFEGEKKRITDDLSANIAALEQEKRTLEEKLKDYPKMLSTLEEKLRREDVKSEKFQAKFERLAANYQELEKRTTRLARQMKRLPKKTTELAHENNELIKDTSAMHYNLGVFYAEQSRFERAIAEFERAAELDPSDSRSHYNLGYLYAQELENHSKAREHFIQYLQLTPQDEGAGWVQSYLLGRETFRGKVLKN